MNKSPSGAISCDDEAEYRPDGRIGQVVSLLRSLGAERFRSRAIDMPLLWSGTTYEATPHPCATVDKSHRTFTNFSTTNQRPHPPAFQRSLCNFMYSRCTSL